MSLSPQSVQATPSPVRMWTAGEMRFIARQPILDRKQKVYGYELLFRSGADIAFADVNCESATRSTIDLSLLLGAESFTEGLPAFINCTRESLCSESSAPCRKIWWFWRFWKTFLPTKRRCEPAVG